MGIRLLDKTRKVNKLIHNYDSNKLNFCDISCVLGDVLDSEILVISRSGKILGASKNNSAIKLSPLLAEKKGEKIDPQLNERLLTILSTKENVNLMTLGFENVSGDYSVIIAPINIAGNRLGTLFVFRKGAEYELDDIILAEYGTTVVGLEINRSVDEEDEEEKRRRRSLDAAIDTLSQAELASVVYVFRELNGMEGILITSRVAEKYGVTRSVIVNGLRKLESGGVIESRSAGMKGTVIRIENEFLVDELEKIAREKRI